MFHVPLFSVPPSHTHTSADNHDIISIKVYDVDIPQEEEGTQGVVCFTVHKTFILFTANHCCFLSPC